MTIQKLGGFAALTEALTYIFGFIFFFVFLNPTGYETPEGKLEFLIINRDFYFFGYLIVGIVFSFALIVLVQAIDQLLKSHSPQLMSFATVVGYLWVVIVLSSSLIFLTSLSALAKYHGIDPEQALTIRRAVNIVEDALGGGIELIGAVWVLIISFVSLKAKIFSPLIHYWGVLVGISGVLTLFAGLSFLSSNPFFEVTTAIFGLGQILWFIALGIALIKAQEIKRETKASI